MVSFSSKKVRIICLLALLAIIPLTIVGISRIKFPVWKFNNDALLASTSQDESILSITPSPIRTVFVIVMENHNWDTIKNSSSAAYITQSLLPNASYATQYYTPPHLHPSEPNYLWMEAGTNFTVKTDNLPSDNHQSTTKHLTTMLAANGVSWKSYQEDIDGNACPVTDKGLYVTRHNPMLFFDDVTDNNNPVSVNCILHIRPFSEFSTDIVENKVAQYNFITPNLCHDMHKDDRCNPDLINNGDSWLATTVPQILNSQAYKDGGALFITWDEGDEAGGTSSDGPVPMLLLSPYAKGGGYSNSIHYTHSSLLRTIQEIFNVTPLLGDAENTTDLADLFVSVNATSAPKKVAIVNAVTSGVSTPTKLPTVTALPTYTSTPTLQLTHTPSITQMQTPSPAKTVHVQTLSTSWATYTSGLTLSHAGFSFTYPASWQVIYRNVVSNTTIEKAIEFVFFPEGGLPAYQKATDNPDVEKELLSVHVYAPAKSIQEFTGKNFLAYKERLVYSVFGQIGNKTMYQVSLSVTDPDYETFGTHGIVLGSKYAYDIGFKQVMSKDTVDKIGNDLWPTFKFE